MRRKGVSSILTITDKTRIILVFNILLVMNSNNECGVSNLLGKYPNPPHGNYAHEGYFKQLKQNTFMKTILITLITTTVAFGNTLPPTPENSLPPTWELTNSGDFDIHTING